LIVLVIPMFFSSVVSVSAIEEDDDGDGDISQFSESQLEKMKSKCMEVDQKGSLDSLKFKDTNLWLMCTQLILEEKTK
jgi:hypothetical protein